MSKPNQEYNLMGSYGDESEGLESYIVSNMTQAEKEEYRRDQKAISLNGMGLSVISVPNKRSEAQKKRFKAKALADSQVKRLCDKWGCKYKLNNLK